MENPAPVMQEIQATEPVFELAVECESLYTNEINSFNDAGNENAAKMLSDLYQRFSSWAAFLGVFAESNVCLDRRLRRHADIQDQVLRLLDIMRRNLTCLSKGGDLTLVGSGPPVENDKKSQPVYAHLQSLNAVSAALERLNQLGIAIRRSSMAKQISKARELTETFDLTSFEQVAYVSLKTLYPDCSESLIEQLTRSMIETYALFLHRKSRKARLEVNRSLPRERQRLQMVPEEPSSDIGGPGSADVNPGLAIKSDYSKAGIAQPVPVRPIRPLYGPPQTQPTSVDIQEFNAHLKRLSNPSIGSKPMSVLANKVGYPRANKDSLVCEWCFGPLTPDFLEGLRWQQHVNEDFKPYVCVSEKCLQPLIRFSSSAEWLQHMISEHGNTWHRDAHAPSSWICPLCTEEDATFHSPDRFSQHLDTHHDGIFRESQVKAIVRQSRFPTARPLLECPLCCLSVTEEQHAVSGKLITGDNGPEKKDYLPTPGGGGPKRIRIDTRSMELRGTSANETIIATHVIAHLQNIMLLSLRLMSIEGPTDGLAGSQSAATDTDYQVSKDPSVGGAASDESRKNSAVDPETAQIPLIFNDEELHGRASGFSNIINDKSKKGASENANEVDITWDFVPILSYDKENDPTIQKILAATRAAVSETVASSERSLSAELTGEGKEYLESISQSIELKELTIAEGAGFGSYMDQHAEECLPGTRTELLLDIQNWAVSAEGKCIFWLNGLAGTGKSTISRTVAKAFQQQGLLGASFFFKRGEGDCGNAARFFPTLAKQLLIRVPELCSTIIEVIQDNPEISAKPLEEQFDELIYKPLHSLNQSKLSSSCLVIVVDTLDECDHDNDIQLILQLLPRVREFKSLCLRFFITSRPDLLIRLGLNTVDHNDLILHEIPKPIIEHDISLFLKHRLATIRHKRSLSPDWPGDANIQTLVTMSVPLFIVAATICRLFEDHNLDPDQCLTEILKYQNQESKFDGTYLPVLDRLVSNYSGRRQMQLVQEVQEVLGVIILLESPLSVISLSKLMGTSTVSITARLNSLHSVLNIPKDEALPVRLFHLSLRYFLLDPSTREKTPFWVNKEQMNRKLLIRCLLVMQKSLKKNICSLKSYGIERRDINPNSIGHYLPSELQYSCRYWIHHLVQSKDLINQVDYILVFLKEHFLHWVEIMSILGYISEVVQGITVLQSAEDRNDSELFQFLHDAKRFILKYREIADIAPLQLYASGLIFTPKRAITRHFFERELPDWIIRGPEVEVHWSSELQPLKGHSFSVQFLAFSPDGRLLATSSGDRTIQLWDPTTNTVIQTLVGHSFPVQSLVFSPDSRILASGSNDTTIKFWDYTTGTAIQILEGHSSSIQSIAFSLDGQLLASGSNDTTIKLWDPTTGAVIQTLEGHLSSVQSVAFSPDSRLLASGSNDATIKLWDPTTGAIIQTLEGHLSSVPAVTFSPDGQLLASGSNDTTIQLWDPTTGALIRTLEGHLSSVQSVAFSPDGRLLASGSGDRTIRLWDPITGTAMQPLGHLSSVQSVAFSPDGRLLASGSGDRTIRLWDPITGTAMQPLGHLSSVQSVAFSPDGSLLASSSDDRTIRLWDPITGTVIRILEGHLSSIQSIAFSPDGRLLASGSSDKTIRLWDPITGAVIRILEGHLSSIQSIAFSPDSRLLASGSNDATIKLWDPTTGAIIQTLEGHSSSIQSIAFSLDGQLLVSSSSDKTIRLWHPATGTHRHTLSTNGTVTNIEFSKKLLHLTTSLGSFDIQDWLESFSSNSSETKIDVSLQTDRWIAIHGQRELWLPPEYRPSCSTVKDATIALGCTNGRVCVIAFSI